MILLAGVTCLAPGQTLETVPIAGTVVDVTGAVIAGAAVDLKQGKIDKITRTDGAGHFDVRAAPGTYLLEVRAEGFEPYEVDQSIAAGQGSRSMRVVLSVRTVQQDVTVPSETTGSMAADANKSALRFKSD